MFRIKWTAEAELQYFETLRYWINHNQSNAYSLKIVEEVEKKEKLLSANPNIGLIIEGAKAETRRVLVLKNFSIYYRIYDEVVAVVSFWENKDNPHKINLHEDF